MVENFTRGEFIKKGVDNNRTFLLKNVLIILDGFILVRGGEVLLGTIIWVGWIIRFNKGEKVGNVIYIHKSQIVDSKCPYMCCKNMKKNPVSYGFSPSLWWWSLISCRFFPPFFSFGVFSQITFLSFPKLIPTIMNQSIPITMLSFPISSAFYPKSINIH